MSLSCFKINEAISCLIKIYVVFNTYQILSWAFYKTSTHLIFTWLFLLIIPHKTWPSPECWHSRWLAGWGMKTVLWKLSIRKDNGINGRLTSRMTEMLITQRQNRRSRRRKATFGNHSIQEIESFIRFKNFLAILRPVLFNFIHRLKAAGVHSLNPWLRALRIIIYLDCSWARLAITTNFGGRKINFFILR